MEHKYNLTFCQRLLLIVIWPMWLMADSDKRKTWHEVKKGMEKHVCQWEDNPYEVTKTVYDIYSYYKCKHEGCNNVDCVREKTERGVELDEKLAKWFKKQ